MRKKLSLEFKKETGIEVVFYSTMSRYLAFRRDGMSNTRVVTNEVVLKDRNRNDKSKAIIRREKRQEGY